MQPIATYSCLRCGREIGAEHKSVAVPRFAQPVGVKPRQESGGAKDLFLLAMPRITGDGAAARGLAEFSRMGHVPRLGELGVCAQSGGGGRFARRSCAAWIRRRSRIGFGDQGSIPQGGLN